MANKAGFADQIQTKCAERDWDFKPVSPNGKVWPSINELAHMPEWRRKLRVGYMGELAPDPAELSEAVALAIRYDYEVIAEKRAYRQVYFIQAQTGPIKIGVADNVAKRLSSMQSGNHECLTLLCARPGGKDTESEYHDRFRAHRLRAEWFNPHADILAEVERIKAAMADPAITRLTHTGEG